MERFLPNIMRMCDDEERAKLILSVNKRMVGKKWIGAKDAQGYAVTNMTTKRGRAEADAGKRAMKRIQPGETKAHYPTIGFKVAHILLIADHRFPQPDDEGSHLCHHTECCDVDHLVWERGDFNRRRKHCQREGECVCGLVPKCMLGVHK